MYYDLRQTTMGGYVMTMQITRGFDSELAIMRDGNMWVLLHPLKYTTADGKIFTIPAGFHTDLATVPAVFRWWIDVTGKHERAAVLHDWLTSVEGPGVSTDYA